MSVQNESFFNSTPWDCEENLNSSIPPDIFEKDDTKNIMTIFSTAIASVGIVANMNVVVVFVCQQKLRRKIPNMFIINQVSLCYFAWLFNKQCTICCLKGV